MPGYAKCPKCHSPLPSFGVRRPGTSADAGGTVAAQKEKPIVAIVVAVIVAGAIIAFFGLRKRGGSEAAPPPPTAQEPTTPQAPAATPSTPVPLPDQPVLPNTPNRPSPIAAAGALKDQLNRQRLWSTVEVQSNRVEIRTDRCDETAFGPVIDSSREALRTAGLTKLRCLEQSGHVVFERDL
jgi:hypothetical protein